MIIDDLSNTTVIIINQNTEMYITKYKHDTHNYYYDTCINVFNRRCACAELSETFDVMSNLYLDH